MFDKLNDFFEMIKAITLWQRIFGWKKIRNNSYDAYEEFKSLLSMVESRAAELEKTKTSLELLKNDNLHLQQSHAKIENELNLLQEKYDTQITALQDLRNQFTSQTQDFKNIQNGFNQQKEKNATLEEKVQHLERENRNLEKTNNQYQQTEEDRRHRYESDIANITNIRQQIQDDRSAEIKEKQNDEIQKLKSMKEMWTKHQASVQNIIKMICQKHTIKYIDRPSFKGNPDNTIEVCDEFIVFDAKSPGSDDLLNFKDYIKKQTEAVEKYAKQENIKKDIFLVIPSNTVTIIDQFCYNMADYNVYVVTVDSLEPIIMCLKRIEHYEFLEQLSPEEKENICRIVGKFAHTAKRRIQVDQFFAREYFEILTKCDSDIPKDMLRVVLEFEKAEKINPPVEKRIKQIPVKDLYSDTQKIDREANAKGISSPKATLEGIKGLPLYDNQQEQEKNKVEDNEIDPSLR